MNFETGRTYRLTPDARVRVYSWDRRWSLTTWSETVPGALVKVTAAYWMPPGADCVAEVLVELVTDHQLRPVEGEAQRKLSIGRGCLDRGVAVPLDEQGVTH